MALKIIHKTVLQNGEYSCGDIGISASEWLRLLHKEKAKQYIDVLSSFLREPEQKSTCSKVGLKYGKPAQHYNSKITNFSIWVEKELGKFRIEGTDGKPIYWCITMKSSRHTSQGFVWQLREELTEALRTYLMEELIEQQRKVKPFNGYEEIYKWALINKAEGKEAVDIAKLIIGENIIDNARIDPVLKFLTTNKPEELNTCLNKLFDESVPLDKRIAGFKKEMRAICSDDWKNCANDERTAAALLTCKSPETYTFYKDEIYQLLCRYFGFEPRYAGHKFSHFTEIINGFASVHGNDVQELMYDEIAAYHIKPSILSMQTLFWCLKEQMKDKLEKAMKNYWLVGCTYDDNGSQIERFFTEGIWESIYRNDNLNDQKLLKLAKEINAGDIIILKSSSTKGQNHDIPFVRVKGVGIIKNNIEVVKEKNITRCSCAVEYVSKATQDFDGKAYGAYRKTIHQADNKVQPIIDYANSLICSEEEEYTPKYKEYINLLKESHNLVLTGAPGTGKTFMAQAIADEMGCTKDERCFVQFHPSYDYTDFVEGLRPIENSDSQIGFKRKDGIFKEFCKKAVKNLIDSSKSVESLTKELTWEEKLRQFVEDAIEHNIGYKLSNGNRFTIEEIKDRTITAYNEHNEKSQQVSVNADEIIELLTNEVRLDNVKDIKNHFNRKNSTQADSYAFIIANEIRKMKKEISMAKADKVERKPFVFIIDEINRGDVSKIFGELFYAIDPGYRGKKDVRVKTQYQNLVPETDVFAEGFYVPENVYILATMNDIDRSVESMDFAMRRRFTWKEVCPDDTISMLNSLACADKAKAAMQRLNKIITETEGLGAAFQVGPSYFLRLSDNGNDFKQLWEMNIEPLLKEYLRGFRKADDILDKFSKAYFSTETTSIEAGLTDEDLSD